MAKSTGKLKPLSIDEVSDSNNQEENKMDGQKELDRDLSKANKELEGFGISFGEEKPGSNHIDQFEGNTTDEKLNVTEKFWDAVARLKVRALEKIFDSLNSPVMNPEEWSKLIKASVIEAIEADVPLAKSLNGKTKTELGKRLTQYVASKDFIDDIHHVLSDKGKEDFNPFPEAPKPDAPLMMTTAPVDKDPNADKIFFVQKNKFVDLGTKIEVVIKPVVSKMEIKIEEILFKENKDSLLESAFREKLRRIDYSKYTEAQWNLLASTCLTDLIKKYVEDKKIGEEHIVNLTALVAECDDFKETKDELVKMLVKTFSREVFLARNAGNIAIDKFLVKHFGGTADEILAGIV